MNNYPDLFTGFVGLLLIWTSYDSYQSGTYSIIMSNGITSTFYWLGLLIGFLFFGFGLFSSINIFYLSKTYDKQEGEN